MTNPFLQFTTGGNPFLRFKQQDDVVATTKDGGRVVRGPDGALSFASPGYSTNDPGAVGRIMEGATPISEAQRTTDNLTISQHPVAARVQEVNQGAPFVGEWLDEGVGVVAPKAADAMRATSDAMERQHPGQSAVLNVAGGVAYTAPLVVNAAGSKAADWVMRGQSKFGRGVRAGSIAAPAAAAEGGSSGAGRDENRARGGAIGAGMGAGLAVALGPLVPLLGEGATAIARRIKKLDVQTIAEELGVSLPSARVLRSYLQNDNLDAAAQVLARGGDDAMLAEAGPGTRQALDTAMQTGGEALSVARPRVDERVQVAGNRFTGTINRIFGDSQGGIKGEAKAIAKGTARAREAAYNHAYGQPTPMTGEAGRQLEAVLARIHPDDLQAAIKAAEKEMRDKGVKNQNYMATIADNGEVTFSQPLSVLQLDYLARGLGDIVEGGTDKLTGKVSPDARRAQGQMMDLRKVLRENVDGYARALKLGGDKIKQTDALVMGRKLLSETTTFEDVRNTLANAPQDVKDAAKKGLRENIEAIVGRARATMADLESGNFDFETGINAVGESVAALRALTSKNNFRKARMVLGTDAKALFDEMEKTADALILRSAVARNSATAIRQAGQGQMAAETAPGMLRRTLGNMGNPLDGAKEITQSIAAIDPQSITDAQRGYYAEIADALTRIKGPAAERALQSVQKAMAGQPIRDAEATLIGRVVAGNAASLGYHTGEQSLTRLSPR